MDKKPNEIRVNLIPMKIKNHAVQYINSYTTINMPHKWPAILEA